VGTVGSGGYRSGTARDREEVTMGIAEWWNGTRGSVDNSNVIPARLVQLWKRGLPLPLNSDYETLAEEGYRRNTIVYACVRAIATSGSEPTPEAVRVVRSEDPEVLPAEHPLTRLLYWPNEEMDSCELIEMLLTHWCVAGEWYVLKRRSAAGRVVDLWPLRPDRIKPMPDQNGTVPRYSYETAGSQTRTIDAHDLIVMRNPDPKDDFRGLSPITVAARMGDIDNQAADYIRAFFLNGGVPNGWLKVKGKIEPPERERVKQKFKDQFSGIQGWHALGVLDEDADWTPAGYEPSKLDLSAVFGVSETRICMCFGVPPILVGAQSGLARATYSNYREAVQAFWKTTLAPLYERMAGKLSRGLAQEFGEDLEMRFDLSDVEGLRESQTELWQRALDGWTRGVMSRNEARGMVGLPRLIDGDVIRQDAMGLEAPAVPDETQAIKRPDVERLTQLAERLAFELQTTENERHMIEAAAGNGHGRMAA
jgi:HK97 family phage portal protein